MPRIEDIRAAVADALEAKGHGNREFLAEIRNGLRDDGPFMIGALIWAEHIATVAAR
jgi:hypothetical protein